MIGNHLNCKPICKPQASIVPASILHGRMPIGLGAITRTVAFFMGLGADEIIAHSRLQRYVRARAAIYWLARRLTCMSSVQIGRYFDRDHSTILSGLTRAEQLRDDDPAFVLMTDRIALALSELREARHGRTS